MKVTKTSTQPIFQPIELKITIESVEEYNALVALVADKEYLTAELLTCDIPEKYVHFLFRMICDIREAI